MPDSPDQLPEKRGWGSRLKRLGFGCLVALLLILLGEVAVRLFAPDVNLQGIDQRLFAPRDADGTKAWQPGAKGLSFGTEVLIDDNGCRHVGDAADPTASWILLGDSVTFGVGVESEETFAGRLQTANPTTRIYNTAVVGTGIGGYRVCLDRVVDKTENLRRVTLFYCLNDLPESSKSEKAASLPAQKATKTKHPETDELLFHERHRPAAIERITDFGRKHSKLFLYLKGTVVNPSEIYFNWMYKRYEEIDGEDDLAQRLAPIATMAAQVQSKGAKFEVVVLPYEFQLREDNPKLWLPQRLVCDYLEAENIDYRDAQDWFEQDGRAPSEFFLFADPMHLSPQGHRLVFARLTGDKPANNMP